jgi:DNA sulfur modification protein DndE
MGIKFKALLFSLPLYLIGAPLTEHEAASIGTDVYIYGYPLVTMEISRRVMTNTAAPGGNKAPMGQFDNLRAFPPPAYKDFTTPNADTLYSFAWLDLSKEPYILHLPDEDNRFYVMQMISGWTDVFADPGTRTTGTKAGNFAITGPFFKGRLPAGVHELRCPTNLAFILGRTYCTGSREDYAKVHKIQDGYSLTPLSFYGKPYTPPPGKIDAQIDMKTSVRDQVNRLDATTFFQIFASLLKDNPPALEDAPMVAQMARIGISAAKPFDMSKVSPIIAKGLSRAPQLGLEKMAVLEKEPSVPVNGWSITLKTGVYGTDYLQRALVAMIGLGANLPEDAVYPFTTVDADDNPLDGANKYTLRFPKGQTPPAKGFWSLTMYTPEFFFAENSINRYSIGPRDHLKYNRDGSLDLYIQHESPGKEKESNWLPAPAGPFILMLRLYWPDKSVLDGTWKPPGVLKLSAK